MVAETLFLHTPLGEFELRRRDRHAVHMNALTRRMHRKAAPAAADFEDAHAGPQAKRIDDALIFGVLRIFERRVEASVEYGTRVRETRIQPALVEGIANVVVRVDVTTAA